MLEGDIDASNITGVLPVANGGTGSSAGASSFPAGSVIYHAANTPPTGFLKADGAAVSRSTYSDLFAAIGTTYGAGDGSTTFLVPDLRGEFMRGWDDSRGIDGSRAFGSAQADELKSHNHNINVRWGATYNSGHVSANSLGGSSADLGHSIASTGGSETRP
jgi:microcystin-dependent protein